MTNQDNLETMIKNIAASRDRKDVMIEALQEQIVKNDVRTIVLQSTIASFGEKLNQLTALVEARLDHEKPEDCFEGRHDSQPHHYSLIKTRPLPMDNYHRPFENIHEPFCGSSTTSETATKEVTSLLPLINTQTFV